MYKFLKRILICFLFAGICWSIWLISERRNLSSDLIRFHVVANSDSCEDQNIKLAVRDAVLDSIHADLQRIADVSEAKKYLQDNIPKIHAIVKKTLSENGYPETSSISLCREYFDIRKYDTFSLPAGIYESFRIVLGEGDGANWWCVAFPTLCIPATSSGFEAAAAGAGFSDGLTDILSETEDYSVSFYFLNCLGQIQNILYRE